VLLRLINRVSPRGSTNLGGGMIEGYRQVERFASKEFTNRVILLSDGLANQGITDPRQLNSIARRNRIHSISLTTMGVGLDYNENLMVGLAEYGGGSYYFIEHPRSIAHILNKEFNSLSSILASFVLGVALGNLVRGIPLGPDKEFTGTFLTLLNPYGVLVGVLTLALFMMLNASQIRADTKTVSKNLYDTMQADDNSAEPSYAPNDLD